MNKPVRQQGNYMPTTKNLIIIAGLPALLYANAALSSPLTFTGQNAALFNTANPNDTAAMMNSVVKPKAKTELPSALDQNRLIIQGLESQITNKIYADIFDNSNVSGHYSLPGGGSVSFIRPGDGNIRITIVDASGTTSEIVVPDI
jgi:hypothetical protein